MSIIEVSHLTKFYGEHAAVTDLSFTLEEGGIYGFLGPNGAGKSTTMNIMTGCLSATEGQVFLNGHDIFEEPKEAKAGIGYLPELPPLYVEETPYEYLEFVAAAKGIGKKDRGSAIEEVIAKTGIEEVQNRVIKHLSKGYKQRVGIAQALLGNPKVLIFDEPTVGLDPAQIIEIRDLIKSLKGKHTVILSSHILQEVQAVCDEVLIIDKGVLKAFDRPENLEKHLKTGQMLEVKAEITEEELMALLSEIPDSGVERVEIKGTEGGILTALLYVGDREPLDVSRVLMPAFFEKGKALLAMNPVKASLEDIFMEITEEIAEPAEITEEAAPETDDPEPVFEETAPDDITAAEETAAEEAPAEEGKEEKE